MPSPSLAKMILTVGNEAPAFRLPNHRGCPVDSADLRGSWALLYWFPKSDTPGCTLQAEGLHDQLLAFDDLGCRVLGASFDTVEELRSFHDDHSLGFDLLADSDRTVGRAFGVAGRDGGAAHPERVSYLIDPAGRIAWTSLVEDVVQHADLVLDQLEHLQGLAADNGHRLD